MKSKNWQEGLTLPKFIENPDPSIFLSDNYCVIDLETTNNANGDASDSSNNIVFGACIFPGIGEHTFVGLDDLSRLDNLLYSVDFIVAHGAKFECKWFIRAGIDVSKILFYDTLLGEFVISGNRGFKLDLNSVATRYGGKGKDSIVSRMIKNKVCPSEIPHRMLKKYCRQDVDETEKVFLKQREILKAKDLLKVFYLRCLLLPVLADMEMQGVYLDHRMVQEIHLGFCEEYIKISEKLQEITGGINMASPQQVAKFIYGDLGFEELKDGRGNVLRNKPNKAFPEGAPKTDEETILILKPKNEKQRTFLDLKKRESKLRRKITGYTTRFMDACEQNSCFMHGTLNQSVAGTHRLSSTDPNLQNIDRALKKMITARNSGWVTHSADYKSLEFVVAGILTKDPQIIEDVQTKFDVHSHTASIIFEKDWNKAGGNRYTTKGDEIRTEAKPDTFKPLFGGTSGTKAQKKYYKAFREKYNTCYRAQMGWAYQVLKTKELRVPTGLLFYWPTTKVTEDGYIVNISKIFNYPIQNFSFELAAVGVVLLWHHIKALALNSFLVNFVHDSVLAEEDPKETEIMRNLFDLCLTKQVPVFIKKLINFYLILPLEIEQKVAKNWDYGELLEREAV